MDYEYALKKPFTDIRKLLIGCALNTVPIVNVLVSGYIVKVAGKTMVGKEGLPGWENWGRLFRNGIFASLIALIYAIPLLAIMLAFFGTSYFNYLKNGEVIHFGLLGGWSVLVIVLGIAVAYIIPGALLNFSKTEIWADGFKTKAIFSMIYRKDYFFAWIFSAIYAIILGMVFGLVPNVAGVIANLAGMSLSWQAKIVIFSSTLSSSVSGYIVGVTAFTVLGGALRKKKH
ncbi:MAG: DUF4013 domain-containing protein [Candidatus Woesearchaeota archaeon]